MCECDLLTGINAVGEDLLNEWKAGLGGFQDRRGAVTVLNRAQVNLDLQRTPIAVHQARPCEGGGVALASLDPLAGVISARSAGLDGFDTLGIDDRGAGAGLASHPLAIEHDQLMVQAFPGPIITKAHEPAVRVWCGGKCSGSMRQGMPRRRTKKIALITSRICQDRCRPVLAGGGSRGARICHSSPVRSLG